MRCAWIFCFVMVSCLVACDSESDYRASEPELDATSREICDNGVDDNGDDLVDCRDSACRHEFMCQEPSSCDNPRVLVANNVPRKGSTVGKGDDFRPSCANHSHAAPDEVFRLDIDDPGIYCVETLGSEFDTILYLQEVCRPRGEALQCNDDGGRGTTSRLEIRTGVESHYIIVDGYGENEGTFFVNVRRGTCEETDCDDGVDNDEDGYTDCAEPTCSAFIGCQEVCDDGIDNNNDGLTDCADPGCRFFDGCREICDDGLDNDNNGYADCADYACYNMPPCGEVCDDGIDNNNDGYTDCADAQCRGAEFCTEICDDGLDNNGDGLTDCEDPYCGHNAVCAEERCEDVLTLTVPDVVDGVLRGDSRMRGSCGNGAGREQVFRVVAPESGQVCLNTVTQRDMVLYARRECSEPNTEILCDDDGGYQTNARLLLELEAGEEVFVVVDEYSAAVEQVGNYRLTSVYGDCVERECGDGVDNDMDMQLDCKDPDCQNTPACDEICDDGLDNNNNGLIDCRDPRCNQTGVCSHQGRCEGALAWPGPGVHSGTLDYFFFDRGYCGGDGPEEIYKVRPTEDSLWCITATGDVLDPVLYVRTSCIDVSTEVACNDDIDGTRTAQVEVLMEAGQEYSVFVDSYQWVVPGDYILEIQEGSCP